MSHRETVRRNAARPPIARIKRLTVAAMTAAALASVSTALAGGGGLAGQYKTTVKSPPEAKGIWILKLAKPSSAQTGPTKRGSYTVVAFGHPFIRGRYSMTGGTITFGHETGEGACAKTGTYTWKKSGKTLRFTRVSDAPICTGRVGVLALPFTQLP
jgi:hypothetical protein